MRRLVGLVGVLVMVGLFAAAPTSASGVAGRIWVDAGTVYLPLGRNVGEVGVHWRTAGDQVVRVWATESGKPEQLWVHASDGDQMWPYVYRDTVTTFILKGGPGFSQELGRVSVTGRMRGAISADRTHIPLRSGELGAIMVSWATVGAEQAQVWVSYDGASQSLFAQEANGRQQATWIQRGTTIFTLWWGTEQRYLLDTLVVTGDSETSAEPVPTNTTWTGFNHMPSHPKRYEEYLDDDVWPGLKEQVARDFDQVASAGGSVVRVVLWPEKSGYFDTAVREPCRVAPEQRWCRQASNLGELIGLARARGIKTVVALDNSYLVYPGWASGGPEALRKWAELINAGADWAKAFVTAIETSSAADGVLYYDLQNEYSGVRGNVPNLQAGYLSLLYDRVPIPAGKRGMSVMHWLADGRQLREILGHRPLDFVDMHAYPILGDVPAILPTMRALFPSSTAIVGELGMSTWDAGRPSAIREREQAGAAAATLDQARGQAVAGTMAWELYDDPNTPPHPASTGYGFLRDHRQAKEAFGVLCGRWGLVPDCGAGRTATAPTPARLEVTAARIPVRGGHTLTPNAILRTNGTSVRIVVRERDAAGGDPRTTELAPVEPGGDGSINYLNAVSGPRSIILDPRTTSADVTLVAEFATRLEMDILTAGDLLVR